MNIQVRTKQQSLTGQSVTDLDTSGINGNITSLTLVPNSGNTQVRGVSTDNWVAVPSGGISYNFNVDDSTLPQVRDDGSGSTLDVHYQEEIRNS